MEKKEKNEFVLPEEFTKVSTSDPRDLVIIGPPKIGKGTIFGDFTKKYNALILDLEKGGYEYISARKMSSYTSQREDRWDSFQNYIKIRTLLLENKEKYTFLLIDGLSDLDDLSDIGGTLAYMNTTIGQKFNRVNETAKGTRYDPNDPEFKSVLTLPDGAGYQHSRKWFLDQVELFRQISPYRIYAAHVVDKYIKDNGKEDVIGSEISLTGKLKLIFASKVTALAKLIAEDEERYLNFDVANNSIIAGSRAPQLKGKMLISRQDDKNNLETFWENIYKEVKPIKSK